MLFVLFVIFGVLIAKTFRESPSLLSQIPLESWAERELARPTLDLLLLRPRA